MKSLHGENSMIRNFVTLTLLICFCPLVAQQFGSLVLINRSFVSIEKHIYSQWDVAAILCMDLHDNENSQPLKLNWMQGNFLPNVNEKNIAEFAKTNSEAARFLLLALSWEEAQNLNLFVPSESELKALIEGKMDTLNCDLERLGEPLARYIANLPEAKARQYADIILRGRTYERVRKTRQRSLKWYWHPLTSPIGTNSIEE